jgi:putative hemolysin
VLTAELLIILGLVLANGVFAGAEIALVALREGRIQELSEQGNSSARAVLALRKDPERFLAAVQVGITVVGATAGAIGGASIAAPLEQMLLGVPWLAEHAQGLSLAVVVAGVSYLTIVIGELVPKSIALRKAERYALLVARPIQGLSWLAKPIVWLLSSSANLLLRPFGDQTTFTEARRSVKELQGLVAEASVAGSIPPETGEIVQRALELPGLTAADVMVPRQQVVFLSRTATRDEVRNTLLEHGHNRVPVYDGTVDNVVGYILMKDVLVLAWERELFVLEDLMRAPYFVPDTTQVVSLMNSMQERHQPFAIVIDEHGGMSGIVTIEDLVEELVGEIYSERADKPPQSVVREPDGAIVVVGTTPVRELNRELDLNLPEEGDWTTIAGLCLSLAGRVPVVGQSFELEGGVVLEIMDASPRRIRKVRIREPVPEPSESDSEPGSP